MNTMNISTGFSPFQLRMGRSPRLILPLTQDTVKRITNEILESLAAVELIDRLNQDLMEAKDNLLAAKVAQSEFASRHCGDEVEFKVGDKVLLATDHRCREYMQSKSGRSAKFMPWFDGLYPTTNAHANKSSYT